VALEGTLRDFSLADIFQLIGLQRKTGVLTLNGSDDTVTVSFLDGKVVGADSVAKKLDDRLGNLLLRSNLVSQGQLDAALRAQMETLERLGHALLRQGALTREELKRALEQQILQIIFRTFRWQDGEYHFSQESGIDYDAEFVSPISAESILMEGARMLDEWPIIEKRISHWGLVFVPTPAARRVEVASQSEIDALDEFEFDLDVDAVPTPEASAGKLLVSYAEQEVLQLVDGLRSVEDIIRRSFFGEFETCKALYTLAIRGIIREATREELIEAAQARTEPTAALPVPRWRLPWLAFLLLPMLLGSLLLAPRNPLNVWLGPGEKIAPTIAAGRSAARMWRVWQALNSRDTLVGSFPETLNEVVREGYLSEDAVRDPWGRPYRYLLRDDAILLGGSTAQGAPDPDLILAQRLRSEAEAGAGGQAVELVNP